MGTFLGHAAPGSFFLVFAFHWLFQITRRRIACHQKRVLFFNTVTHPCFCGRAATLPLEGLFKILACVTGFVAELITSSDGTMHFYGNYEHMTMYTLFLVSGVVDVIQNRVASIPKGTDYIVSTLAFTGEFVLFKYHLHGRTELDVLLHTLLLYTIGACIIATLVELKLKTNPLAAYVRTFAVFVQGTWFIQVGYILYNPIPGAQQWDSEEADNLMLATMIFCWHLIGVLVTMMLFIFVIHMCYRYNTNCCIPIQGEIEYKMLGRKDLESAGVMLGRDNGPTINMGVDEGELGLDELSEMETPLMSNN